MAYQVYLARAGLVQDRRYFVGELLGGHLDVTESAQPDLFSDRPDETLESLLSVFESECLHSGIVQTCRHSVPVLLILGGPVYQDHRDTPGCGTAGFGRGREGFGRDDRVEPPAVLARVQ